MRRSSPAPVPAPPPRRPVQPTPGPRAAPPRAAGPARGRARTRRRRRSVVVAALLTVLILLGYGGYTGWNALVGGRDDPTESALPTGTGYAASAERARFNANIAIILGVNLRIAKDSGRFVQDVNRSIDGVRAERARMEQLAATATGARADVLRSSIEATQTMDTGMSRWRDAIYNLRLGGVDAAEATIRSGIAELEADLERWKSLTG